MDMTEFLAQDYDDIRMPVNALRFFVFKDKMQFELLVVPTFEGYRLSTDAANPWSVLPKESLLPLVWNEKGSLPKLRLSNMEYGGRLSFTLPGLKCFPMLKAASPRNTNCPKGFETSPPTNPMR